MCEYSPCYPTGHPVNSILQNMYGNIVRLDQSFIDIVCVDACHSHPVCVDACHSVCAVYAGYQEYTQG